MTSSSQSFVPPALAALCLAGGIVCGAAANAAEPIWDANQVQMVSESLAPGVFAYFASNAKELNAKGGAAATSGGLEL